MKNLGTAAERPGSIESILSDIGVAFSKNDIASDESGLPLLGKPIYTQLSKVDKRRIREAGLFWKETGEGGHVFRRGFLKKEAVRAAKINSAIPDNSPRIYAILGEGDNQSGYLMEFVDGYQLNDLLRAKKISDGIAGFNYTQKVIGSSIEMRVSAEDILSIKTQLNHTINELRERKIYHGDLWPPNIIVTKKGNTVKLIDPWWDAEPYLLNKCQRNDYAVLSEINDKLDALIAEII